jgi:hypothetical protein
LALRKSDLIRGVLKRPVKIAFRDRGSNLHILLLVAHTFGWPFYFDADYIDIDTSLGQLDARQNFPVGQVQRSCGLIPKRRPERWSRLAVTRHLSRCLISSKRHESQVK